MAKPYYGAQFIAACVAYAAITTSAAAQQPTPALPAQETEIAAIDLPPVLIAPIVLDRSDRMTLPVTIAGQGPFGFIVDTGAERTVLSRELADRLGLRSAGNARVVGLADTVTTAMFHLDTMALHDVMLAESIVPTFAQRDIGGPGLIGIESLENHKVIIDFITQRLDIRPSVRSRSRQRELDFDRDAIVVTGRRVAGRMILSNARIGNHRIEVVIDTGAQSSIGNLALQRLVRRELGRSGAALHRTELRSVTGATLDAVVGVIGAITVSGVDFMDLPVVYADSPAFAALGLDQRPTIMLGMDALQLLDRIAIDFTNRRVTFDLPDGAQRMMPRRFAFAQ